MPNIATSLICLAFFNDCLQVVQLLVHRVLLFVHLVGLFRSLIPSVPVVVVVAADLRSGGANGASAEALGLAITDLVQVFRTGLRSLHLTGLEWQTLLN